MHFVVAQTQKEAVEFIRQKKWHPSEFRIVSEASQLHGQSNFEVWFIGAYDRRPDRHQIETLCYMRRGVLRHYPNYCDPRKLDPDEVEKYAWPADEE